MKARLHSSSLENQVNLVVVQGEFVLVRLKKKEKIEEVPDDG